MHFPKVSISCIVGLCSSHSIFPEIVKVTVNTGDGDHRTIWIIFHIGNLQYLRLLNLRDLISIRVRNLGDAALQQWEGDPTPIPSASTTPLPTKNPVSVKHSSNGTPVMPGPSPGALPTHLRTQSSSRK